MNEENRELVKQFKQEVRKGQFSIGDLAKQFGIALQKARYLVHKIAHHEGLNVVRAQRGIWTLER